MSEWEHMKIEESIRAELSRLRELVREMREAALLVEGSMSFDRGDDTNREVMRRLRTAIAKADAILKESGEPVKYGCHKNAQVTSECAIDINSPLCLVARVLSRKEDCSHWKPIK